MQWHKKNRGKQSKNGHHFFPDPGINHVGCIINCVWSHLPFVLVPSPAWLHWLWSPSFLLGIRLPLRLLWMDGLISVWLIPVPLHCQYCVSLCALSAASYDVCILPRVKYIHWIFAASCTEHRLIIFLCGSAERRKNILILIIFLYILSVFKSAELGSFCHSVWRRGENVVVPVWWREGSRKETWLQKKYRFCGGRNIIYH